MDRELDPRVAEDQLLDKLVNISRGTAQIESMIARFADNDRNLQFGFGLSASGLSRL